MLKEEFKNAIYDEEKDTSTSVYLKSNITTSDSKCMCSGYISFHVNNKEYIKKLKEASKELETIANENTNKLDEIAIKYKGYIQREQQMADKIMRLENLIIPDGFDFDKVESLSIECRQKLKKYSPRTIARASRIP